MAKLRYPIVVALLSIVSLLNGKYSQVNIQAHDPHQGVSSAATSNLVQNPSFETGDFAQGWEYHGDPNGARSSVDGTVSHSGNYSAKIVFDGTTDVNYSHVTQHISVNPGASYRLSGYIRTAEITTASGAQLEVQDARGWTFLAIGTQVITGTHFYGIGRHD